jgi:uncharacterized membrane protein YidH (DUF202 family)
MPRGDTAPERTRLSWRRTTLTATAVTLLLVRLSLQHHVVFTAALAGLCWVFVLALIQQRIRSLKTPGRPPRRLTMLTATAVLCFGGLGVVLVLL